MCGIVGIIGSMTQQRAKLFKHMLVADTVRGKHSTGVFAIDKDNAWSYVKRAVSGGQFVLENDLDNLSKGWDTASNNVLIGHNRAATIGEVTTKNAHPFVFENVIGVHNGTLDTEAGLVRQDDDGNVYPVDSQRLYATLNKTPVEEVPKFLETIDGAYTLVWWDARTNRVYMARNKERPLAIGRTAFSIMIASELGMLQWLVGKVLGTAIKVDYEELPIGEMWSFDYSHGNPYSTKEVVKFTPKPASYYWGKSGYGSGYSGSASTYTADKKRYVRRLTHKLTSVDNLITSDYNTKLSDFRHCSWFNDMGNPSVEYGDPLNFKTRYGPGALKDFPEEIALFPVAFDLISDTAMNGVLWCVDDGGYTWAIRYCHVANVHMDKVYIVDKNLIHKNEALIVNKPDGSRGVSVGTTCINGISAYMDYYGDTFEGEVTTQ